MKWNSHVWNLVHAALKGNQKYICCSFNTSIFRPLYQGYELLFSKKLCTEYIKGYKYFLFKILERVLFSRNLRSTFFSRSNHYQNVFTSICFIVELNIQFFCFRPSVSTTMSSSLSTINSRTAKQQSLELAFFVLLFTGSKRFQTNLRSAKLVAESGKVFSWV